MGILGKQYEAQDLYKTADHARNQAAANSNLGDYIGLIFKRNAANRQNLDIYVVYFELYNAQYLLQAAGPVAPVAIDIDLTRTGDPTPDWEFDVLGFGFAFFADPPSGSLAFYSSKIIVSTILIDYGTHGFIPTSKPRKIYTTLKFEGDLLNPNRVIVGSSTPATPGLTVEETPSALAGQPCPPFWDKISDPPPQKALIGALSNSDSVGFIFSITPKFLHGLLAPVVASILGEAQTNALLADYYTMVTNNWIDFSKELLADLDLAEGIDGLQGEDPKNKID